MKLLKKRQQGWLVIHQQADGWRWCSELPGQPVQQGDSLNDMPADEQVDTILLLPGERVTLALITLADANAQALCWQLEPLLSEDLEHLHVVSLDSQGDRHLMAAIRREDFRQTLKTLAEHGYIPHRVLPDTLSLAPGTRLHLGEQWLLRPDDRSGLALPDSALIHFPQLCNLKPLPGDALVALAAGARANRYTLLQGAFAPRPALRMPLIALSAALFLCWFSVLFPPLWHGWQAQSAITQLDQQLLVRYQHYFPQETPALVRRAFSRKAAQPEAAQIDAGMLALLQHSSTLLGKLHENPLQMLIWDGATQQLRLTFRDTLPANILNDAPGNVQVAVKDTQLLLSRKS
jgi:type II secretion system protein L